MRRPGQVNCTVGCRSKTHPGMRPYWPYHWGISRGSKHCSKAISHPSTQLGNQKRQVFKLKERSGKLSEFVSVHSRFMFMSRIRKQGSQITNLQLLQLLIQQCRILHSRESCRDNRGKRETPREAETVETAEQRGQQDVDVQLGLVSAEQ